MWISEPKVLYLSIKKLLIINEENTKDSHYRDLFSDVIKTRLLFSSNFCALENITFQPFYAYQRDKN